MSDDRILTVAVLGSGGIGGLVGGLLARAGHRVIMVARDETADYLKAHPMEVASRQFGDFTVPVDAVTVLESPVDVCVVAVKHTALASSLPRVPASVIGNGLVVPLLNGFEHADYLRTVYPAELVVPGVIRVESSRPSPGVIQHSSTFTEIDLASATAAPARVETFARALAEAGITASVHEDEQAMLWGKLFLIAPFALMTTHYKTTWSGLRENHLQELMSAVDETTAVGRAWGVDLDPAIAMARYEMFRPEAKSSMQLDAEAGAPIELDALGGAIVRAAKEKNISTPTLERLIAELGRRS